MNEGSAVYSWFLDLSKAFEPMEHDRLLEIPEDNIV